MNNAKKIGFILLVIGIMVIASGCTISFGKKSDLGGNDGGIWKTTDGGVTWEQKVNMPSTSGKPLSIAGISVRRMVMDPQDRNTIYVTTEGSGILYTHDGAKTWRHMKDFATSKIRSIAIDPRRKCTLYVVKDNKLFRSLDCGRFWQNIYFHQNSEVILTDVVIDSDDNTDIYITTSSGEVVKSTNAGQSWFTSHRAGKSAFVDLVMNPHDSKEVYAATLKSGIFKTDNSGLTWSSLGAGLKSYSGSHVYRDLAVEQDATSSLIFISRFGMLRSHDGGESWNVVELVPTETDNTIYALGINPQNSSDIYYTTRDTLVKSTDGGETWSSHRLPFTKPASRILVNPDNPNIVYIGTKTDD